MLVEVSPTSVVPMLGEPVTLVVTVVNTEAIISAHEVTILGADPSWVTLDQTRLSLFPQGVGVVTATVVLPAGIPAGTRRIAVQVREITAPGAIEVIEVELVVPAQHGTRIELEPPSITGGSEAALAVVLENEGNADLDIILVGGDADMAVRFAFEPSAGLVLAAGERYTATAKLRAKRPMFGSPKVRQFTIAATVPEEEPVAALGTFIQRPRFSRGLIGLLGLLAVISIFAAVIATTFGRVADRSASDRDLVLEALREGEEGVGTGGTGSIGGTVTLLTGGTPVPGVTVELFAASDAGVPLANVATESDGSYRFTDLGEGRYKLRFRGAGFTELWYPLSLTSENADEVELGPGQAVEGIDIRLGGVPASVAGTVSGDDPAGATVSVRLPAAPTDPAAPATASGPAATGVVATVAVDAGGAFTIADLPSPSVYEISVSKEGFATEQQTINLSAGEARTGLQFNLRRGDGTIAGRVLSPSGNLGGATVAASDGRTTIRTVSLTRDDVGAFTLRNLPTPATYTIVFSAPGHVTQTLTVALGVAERRDGVVALLGTDAGSISGTVSVAGQGPAGGVRVRATSGEVVVETVTLSTGDVGSYTLVGLRVPATYTVTFERDDLAPQTRSVDLDTLGRQHVTGIDAVMQPANGTVFGVVTDQDGGGLGEVTVTLTSGGRTFQTTTASEPPGAYEVRGIPPGTYSVSFTRPGSSPAALLVTVGPGDRVELNASLTARAAVRGTVFVLDDGPTPVEDARVRLFTCAAYGSPNPIPPPEIVLTDVDGRFAFTDLDAPECYVLDFAPPGANAPVQQSRLVTLEPGEDFDISAPGSGVPPVVLTGS